MQGQDAQVEGRQGIAYAAAMVPVVTIVILTIPRAAAPPPKRWGVSMWY